MKKAVILAALAIFALSNGFASSTPTGSEYDARITFQDYNSDNVIKLFAKDGFVTTISLSSGERVIDMFTGFADGWDIQDRGSFVFVKPKAFINKQDSTIISPKSPEWNTNLIITTNQRIYVFDLVIVERQQPIYKVSFEYPVERANQRAQEAKNSEAIKKHTEEVNYIKDRLTNLNNPRNWNFYMKVNTESERIAPVFAYDDGIFTYLGFDNTKSIPSVFLYEKGSESILNTHMKEQGEYQILVVHKVAPTIILRAGEKVVGIRNNAYGVNPAPSGTTISQEVTREVK